MSKHEHVADTESRCTECRARGLLRRMAEKDQRERIAYASLRARFPERFNENGSIKPGPFPSSRGLDVACSPTPAIASQGRMRKPRRADQDENLRNDVAGMIADMCLPAEVLGPRLMDGAHQIVVVVRERVLRELESYARENIR